MAGPSDQKSEKQKRAWGDRVQSTEEQRELREEILFETAARLFNQFGFHGTSMSRLTEELGLTKGALYYYVKDKSDLLYKLHLKSVEATRQSHDKGVSEGRNGLERIHGIVRHYVMTVASSPTETFILLEEGVLNPDQTQEVLDARKSLGMKIIHQIEAGIEDGSVIPCDPKLVYFMLLGAMAWINTWYDPEKEWTIEQFATGMADLLTRMISSAPASELSRDISDI